MSVRIFRHFRNRAAFAFGLVVAYGLFAVGPFLFVHAHQSENSSVVHAHVPMSTGDERSHDHGHSHDHGSELSHLFEHAEAHAQESSGEHFGLDAPPPVLKSPNTSHAAVPLPGVLARAFNPIVSSPPELERLPADTRSIAPCHFADGFPPFLTSALPPPSLA